MTNPQAIRILKSAGFAMTSGSDHWIFRKNGIQVVISHGTHSPWWAQLSIRSAVRRAGGMFDADGDTTRPRHLAARDVAIDQPVRSLFDFAEVPAGTVGVIKADYGCGFIVEWDTPEKHRDGFDKVRELTLLEPI